MVTTLIISSRFRFWLHSSWHKPGRQTISYHHGSWLQRQYIHHHPCLSSKWECMGLLLVVSDCDAILAWKGLPFLNGSNCYRQWFSRNFKAWHWHQSSLPQCLLCEMWLACVDRAWLCCVPGIRSVYRADDKALKAIKNQVKAWHYSWIQSSCETHDE